MTDWVRLWHDMPTDPKWRAIARKSGQPLPCVIALFNLIMVNASGNAEARGALLNWDDEDAAAALDMDTEAVAAIMSAMEGKVIQGGRLTGWEKRQPKREDDSAKRVRDHRKRKAEEQKRDVTHGNAPETETETETDIVVEARADDFVSLTAEFGRIAGVSQTSPARLTADHDVVRGWIAIGADPNEDIAPAIRQTLMDATEPINSLKYFDNPVRQAFARKEARANGSKSTAKTIRDPVLRALADSGIAFGDQPGNA